MFVLKRFMLSVLVFVVMCLVLALGGEIYLRIKHPFNRIIWSAPFDSQYGFRFTPGETVRWTNHIEYWTSARVNSLGFLDAEPPQAPPPDACRVVFMGDSYVEAAQVPIAQKLQVVFGQLANLELEGRREIFASAFGNAGMGQSNELSLYDYFVRPIEPDVVVLVFVRNDFANNSALLETVRNGWSPEYPPRFFFGYDADSENFSPIPISTEWGSHILPSAPYEHPPQLLTRLSDHSYFYSWLNATIISKNHTLLKITQQAPIEDIYLYRMEWLKQHGYPDAFGDWDPRTKDIDKIFLEEDLPPVFEEALLLTGHALDEFVERSQQDGSDLLILVSEQVTEVGGGVGSLYRQRIVDMASSRDIPIVDQWDYIVAQGEEPSSAHFPLDYHWNKQGHRWAAEAMLQYFQQHADLCSQP